MKTTSQIVVNIGPKPQTAQLNDTAAAIGSAKSRA
eukprot:gene102-10989_t